MFRFPATEPQRPKDSESASRGTEARLSVSEDLAQLEANIGGNVGSGSDIPDDLLQAYQVEEQVQGYNIPDQISPRDSLSRPIDDDVVPFYVGQSSLPSGWVT